MAKRLRTSFSEVPKQLQMLAILLIGTLAVGTFGFMFTDNLDFTGALVYTFESLAFRTHTTTSHWSMMLETFMKAVGVVIVWFAIWSAFGLAIEGQFGGFLQEAKMMKEISKLRGHYIVCGAGKVGRNAGVRLAQRGEKVIFLEKDKSAIDQLAAQGHLVMDVGLIDEKALHEAGVYHAKGVVVALGDDSKNLLLVLTAKEMNPNIIVAVRASEPRMIPRLKRAGADIMILPEAIGGVKLADALLGNLNHDVIVRHY
jgi:voltage-gated potassium channel